MSCTPLCYFDFCFQDFKKLNKRLVILEEKGKERMTSTLADLTSENVTHVRSEKVRLARKLN